MRLRERTRRSRQTGQLGSSVRPARGKPAPCAHGRIAYELELDNLKFKWGNGKGKAGLGIEIKMNININFNIKNITENDFDISIISIFEYLYSNPVGRTRKSKWWTATDDGPASRGASRRGRRTRACTRAARVG